MKREDLWEKAAGWAGWSLSVGQFQLLDRYRDWLLAEALPAGGIGPAEIDRVDSRHIADSLLFATGLDQKVSQVADLGSGVGLPGIPLAILMPDTQFRLIDRSGRRVDLMRRVTRILDLDNVEISLDEIDQLQHRFPAIVSRGTLSPDQAALRFSPLLEPGGVVVIGGSWKQPPQHEGWETRHVPANVLGNDVWILIMRPS